jgi:hypothetical protein
MPIHPYPQPKPGPLKKVGPLLLGILALLAEAAIMAALMVMAGICAIGSIIWWLVLKGTPKTWGTRGLPPPNEFGPATASE